MKRGSNTVIPYEDIDYELVELIKCMNNIEGIETVECCCGHGAEPCQIWFVADSIEDVTHFIRDYIYRSPLWRIVIDITDVDIDKNKWDNPTYLLETTCNDYYYTGVCIDNLTYKMKMKQLIQKEKPRIGEWLRMSNLSEQEDDRYKCSHCGNIVHHKDKMTLYTFNSWCGRCGSNNGRKNEVK